jgi:hypothetical protein
MGKIRQNCKWIPLLPEESDEAGKKYQGHDHPDLLRALRALSNYDIWVSDRLIPIVSKWIDENRDRVTDGMTEDEMNDMGAAIEKAYQIIKADGYIASRLEEGGKSKISTKNINPIWQETTKKYIEAERDK